MWFKKASVIASENKKPNVAALKNASPDGKDRTTGKGVYETPPNNTNITQYAPTNLSNYFFLPAMGYYAAGELKDFGKHGRYWASTLYYYNEKISYNLYFYAGDVVVSNTSDRNNGYRLWTSE